MIASLGLKDVSESYGIDGDIAFLFTAPRIAAGSGADYENRRNESGFRKTPAESIRVSMISILKNEMRPS